MVQPKTRPVRFTTCNLIKGIGITKVIEDKTNAFTNTKTLKQCIHEHVRIADRERTRECKWNKSTRMSEIATFS